MGTTSEQKFRELVLYVCLRSEGDPWFGVTKLNKLLYFIDTESFRQRGETVSGQIYVKRQYGPVPEHIGQALKTLKDAEALIMRDAIVGMYQQQQPLALRGPDMAYFKPEELCLVDTIIRQYLGMTASDFSNLSHRTAGWRLAAIGEYIPIASELVSDRDLSAEEMAFAHKVAALPGVREFIAAGAR